MTDISSEADHAGGIRRGLTDYGDPAFSLFIRGAYARGAGLTAEDLTRPIIGIAQTAGSSGGSGGRASGLPAIGR